MGLFSKKSRGGEAVAEQPSAPTQGQIDLMKTRVDLVKKISLEKKIPETQKSRVALVLDYSGSMRSLYQSGFVQKLLERLMPLGIRFDDNEAIDVFVFHNKAYEVGEVDPTRFVGFINNEVSSKYQMGGTNYAPIVKMITEKYTKEQGDVGYVMFITDGDCSDKDDSRKAITKAAESGIFWQFVGIGTAGFGFLQELDDMPGRVIDNANFFQVKDIDSMTDEDLYSSMMDEYPDYLVEAKTKGII